MNICSGVTRTLTNAVIHIKDRTLDCFKGPVRRRPELYVPDEDSMRRPGPRSESLARLRAIMDSGELELAGAKRVLEGLKQHPLTLDTDVIYLPGYLDPGSRWTGTDLLRNLSPYLRNPQSIRCIPFVGAAFRRKTIEWCALQVILRLNKAYADCVSDIISLNIVGHSMGARTGEVVMQLLHAFPELGTKTYKFHKLISLNGANLGAPLAATLFDWRVFCCSEDILKDLRPKAIAKYDRGFSDLDTLGTYLSVEGDAVIPVRNSAPEGRPILVLRDVSRVHPHTAAIGDPVAILWVARQLTDE